MSIAFPETSYRDGGRPNDPVMDWYFNAPPTTDRDGFLLDQVVQDLYGLERSSSEPWPDTVRDNAFLLARAGLSPGVDFLVIPYIGRPKTASQNATSAQRHGVRGVEAHNITKSFAGFADTDSGSLSVVILTGPSDLSFKTSDLVGGQVGELEPLSDDQLSQLGMEHGTVNPIGALMRDSEPVVTYLFDEDFINRKTRDADQKVYISAGDPGWSIALDIRKLMAAATRDAPFHVVRDICNRGPENDRIFARRDITLFSGDSSQVGPRYHELIEASIRTRLTEAGAYFGDASMPNMDILSRPVIGGTGSIALHGAEVTSYLVPTVRSLPTSLGRQRLVAFTSNAANLPAIVNPLAEAINDRPDLSLVTVNDALRRYIDEARPSTVIVFGLPDVVEQYPISIGDESGVIVKGKGNIAKWMQAARAGSEIEIHEAAQELKTLIERTTKLQMANRLGLDGRQKGDFMQNTNVTVEGTIILAGTELWEILVSQGWQDGLPGLDKITLIDPIALLMQHLAELSLTNQS